MGSYQTGERHHQRGRTYTGHGSGRANISITCHATEHTAPASTASAPPPRCFTSSARATDIEPGPSGRVSVRPMPHVTQAEARVLVEAIRERGRYVVQLRARME